FEAVQEDDAFPVVVLDEFLDHLRERPDRRRIVEVLSGGVAEPDHPAVGYPAFAANALRILARDAQPRDLLCHETLEEAVAHLRFLLFDQIADALLHVEGRARADGLSFGAHRPFLGLYPSHCLSPYDLPP